MKTNICSHCNGTGRVIDDRAMGGSMRRERTGKHISAAYLSDLELGRRHWNTEMIRRFKAGLSA